MTNPLVHALVFIAAVIIPGGLLVYFAWRVARKASSTKSEPNYPGQKEGFEDNSDQRPTPEEALSAFLEAFPKYSKDSLRAQSRSRRLHLARPRPKKKPQ
jgi:hypothetical protein